MQFLTTGLVALVIAIVCGLSGFVILADGPLGQAGTLPARPPVDDTGITSRSVDGRPLSLPEVWPDPTIRAAGSAATYTITMTHIDNDCRVAATGSVAPLIAGEGCTQVVRAAMTTPYDGYLVTAGIFNLADAAGARTVDERIRDRVESGAGGFGALGRLGTVDSPGSSQVGWRIRGHYLLYCVITRPDGGPIGGDDGQPAAITADLVETYLAGALLDRRAAAR